MRRLISVAIVLGILWGGAGACVNAPSSKKRPVVNVAASVFPGGAPPSVLALYKAALEVNKNAGDFELRISTISPPMQDPGVQMMEKVQIPPAVVALEQAMTQDSPPDVVLFSGMYEFDAASDKDLLQALDTYIRSDKSVKPDDYFPGAIEALSDSGRLYALPINVAPTVLMYDKRVFDEAGVSAPEANWNWSTFLGYSKQLTKANGDPQNDRYAISLSGAMLLPAFIWQNGGDIVSKDGKRSLLTEPATLEAIKFYFDLINTYKVVPPEFKPQPAGPGMSMSGKPMPPRVGPGEIAPLWTPMGRVAMNFAVGAGSQMGYMPFMRGGQDRPIRLIELPRGKVPATMLDVYTALAMTSKATNGPAAYKAIVALANEMQKELGVPARRSSAKNLRQINPNIAEDDAQVILNSLEYARPLRISGKPEAMQSFYQKLVSPVMQKTKSVEEAVKDASDALDDALNK